MDRSKIPGLKKGTRHPDWQSVYRDAKEETLPWYFKQLDPDIESALSDAKHAGKTLLDIGTGLGNQAYLASQLGFKVTAADFSKAAIEQARRRYPQVSFFVDDIRSTALEGRFDIIVDKGCFHVLDGSEHARYLNSVKKLLKPGGLFLLKVFNSEMGKSNFGPLRFSGKQMVQIFDGHFQIIKLRRTVYHGSVAVAPLAWFVVMRGERL